MLSPYVYHIFPFLPLLKWLLPMLTLTSEMILVLVLLCKELVCCSSQWLMSSTLSLAATFKMASSAEVHVEEEKVVEESVVERMSVLDLPDLFLEDILTRLSPAELCNMALVCRSMGDWCRRDHLWERHVREKWGRVTGEAACRKWQREVALRKESLGDLMGSKASTKEWYFGSLARFWPLSWLRSNVDSYRGKRKALPLDSTMSWYLALENGKFWFPAQVYNRENGHVGFMLSCYNADLSYDKRTDTFFARYPPHGRRTVMVENGVTWDRIRISPVTSANALHVSDCLHELRPGNHIEIQWRRNKDFPYGWWYGIVGHMASCDRNEIRCRCHNSDTVVLEFNHYAPNSRWRQAFINRKDHREEGNETDGFYGGIRKLKNEEEISMWKKFWPNGMLE